MLAGLAEVGPEALASLCTTPPGRCSPTPSSSACWRRSERVGRRRSGSAAGGHRQAGAPAEVVETLDRGELVAVQTPQAFRADVLRTRSRAISPGRPTALARRARAAAGCVVEGDPRLVKVTTRASRARRAPAGRVEPARARSARSLRRRRDARRRARYWREVAELARCARARLMGSAGESRSSAGRITPRFSDTSVSTAGEIDDLVVYDSADSIPTRCVPGGDASAGTASVWRGTSRRLEAWAASAGLPVDYRLVRLAGVFASRPLRSSSGSSRRRDSSRGGVAYVGDRVDNDSCRRQRSVSRRLDPPRPVGSGSSAATERLRCRSTRSPSCRRSPSSELSGPMSHVP